MNIGANLKAARETAGLSVIDAALVEVWPQNVVGHDASWLLDNETGGRRHTDRLRVWQLRRLARVYGCTVMDLVRGEDVDPSTETKCPECYGTGVNCYPDCGREYDCESCGGSGRIAEAVAL